MDYKEFINMILSEVCADDRITKGIFEIENPEHLVVLKEYVTNYTDEEFGNSLMKEISVNEGNYPERQAFNDNGVLVTFPDPESKKAAIERGTHHENPPSGAESDGNVDDEEVENVFSKTETPEERIEREKLERSISPIGTNITPDDIKFTNKSQDKSSKERHRLYDILKGIKTSKDDDDTHDVQSVDGEDFQLDRLHPSVLFALHEKWVFDKSGDWYDENGKFRGDTDLRGQVHPSKQQDKDKMILWIEDYEKRQSGIDVQDNDDKI